MSVNSEMTAIADLIRGLRGVSGKMGLDAMKGHLQDEQDGLDSALAALAEKGVTVPDGTKVDGLAALIAAIESGGGSGGVDVSWFEGMSFEEGSVTFDADTFSYNAIATGFTQCYGGIVVAEGTTDKFSNPYLNLGCYQADAKNEYRFCVAGGNTSYYGVNLALDGYYGAKYIYLAFGQYDLKFKAGVTYKWIAWGV